MNKPKFNQVYVRDMKEAIKKEYKDVVVKTRQGFDGSETWYIDLFFPEGKLQIYYDDHPLIKELEHRLVDYDVEVTYSRVATILPGRIPIVIGVEGRWEY